MKASGIWILAEQKGGKIADVSFELLTRGIKLSEERGCELAAVILGKDLSDADLQELIDRGADRVICIEAEQLDHFLVEPYSNCLLELLGEERPEVLIAAATSTGRTLMPYLAIQANAGLTADCTELSIEKDTGNLLQTRPAIGGNIMATIKTPEHRPQMATVRPRSAPPATRHKGRSGPIERFKPSEGSLGSRVKRLSFLPDADEKPLGDAGVVVAVGKGIKKAENIAIVKELADALGGALGATREVVDRGWLSYPHQIGLSGQTISPKLYVGVGVSGTIQHLAGMQTSEVIVAINNDPEAQIFKIADFGVVGNLFDVVPAMVEKLKAGRGMV
ncbi:Electron transfer flavoprotein large subunit [Anaerohalosphaera lusitana]|uniref:Electron transfer flavoprotein large subunit n=1 Tax=Anaerohalosphaera lusitana TaxID=1936003 RepID=A0A1U9NM65_9BACT|nr:electron transfer flavoprotein subunit alpha/FixB family protein [Anaerohalosphaera lusitana]AQT68999.1 Electron transfer flavoprotein large subunit [Anaerohalosphaera lusitana]